uniref:Ovule protein n=1 Tax=Caenorhabditis tropicalis TaxID=1561998 RepID=A0A1I7UNG1_9PELO
MATKNVIQLLQYDSELTKQSLKLKVPIQFRSVSFFFFFFTEYTKYETVSYVTSNAFFFKPRPHDFRIQGGRP